MRCIQDGIEQGFKAWIYCRLAHSKWVLSLQSLWADFTYSIVKSPVAQWLPILFSELLLNCNVSMQGIWCLVPGDFTNPIHENLIAITLVLFWIAPGFMPDYFRSSTYQMYAISRILDNLIAINPVLFQVASELQCFHTQHLRSSTLQICVFSHSKSSRIWYCFVPSCSSIAINPFCAKFLLNLCFLIQIV